jgi:hypothetical protein
MSKQAQPKRPPNILIRKPDPDVKAFFSQERYQRFTISGPASVHFYFMCPNQKKHITIGTKTVTKTFDQLLTDHPNDKPIYLRSFQILAVDNPDFKWIYELNYNIDERAHTYFITCDTSNKISKLTEPEFETLLDLSETPDLSPKL